MRNHTAALLRRVEAGEQVTITVDGRPAAVLRPVPSRRRWTPRADFAFNIGRAQADAALGVELHALAPDTTDDVVVP